MLRSDLLRKILTIRPSAVSSRLNSTNVKEEINIQSIASDDPDVFDEEIKKREEEIERKRNKSRLKEYHRNIVHNQNPYPEPAFWYHGTLKYMRKVYGKYGEASGIDPAVCWPVKEELEETLEYEKVAYPFTIPQMIEEAHRIKKEKYDRKMKRQQEIAKKIEKLEDWKQDLADRIAKKENEAMAAKMKRERLIEEVKRHFGYTVDPRDEKFKEMLAKKEKEQKKAEKEARKKAKEDKVIEKLLKKKAQSGEAKGDAVDEKAEAVDTKAQKQD